MELVNKIIELEEELRNSGYSYKSKKKIN